MANPEPGRTTLRPPGARASYAPPSDRIGYGSEPPGQVGTSDDFLFYLSRGSELLKNNQIEPAKEALELALGLQPRDLRGQGLLGVVYFRLGLYPRAIEIFEQIVQAYPSEVSPKVNLALCFVKTGQAAAARELLEDVVQLRPEHTRAWAYLGLVFQFQADYEKAQVAFERAGQQAMAARMRLYAEQIVEDADEDISEERWQLRAAAEDAFGELENETTPFRVAEPLDQDKILGLRGKWCATEPGEQRIPEVDRVLRRPSTPPPSVRPAAASVLPNCESPTSQAAPEESGSDGETGLLRDWFSARSPGRSNGVTIQLDPRTLVVDLEAPFAVRTDAVVLLSPLAVARSEQRMTARGLGHNEHLPLGGASSPIVGFTGPGKLIARATENLELFELTDETVTVRESCLFGFSVGLRYECERCRLASGQSGAWVKLDGRGFVALALSGAVRSVRVPEGGLVVRTGELVGWTARVLPEMLDSAESPGRARGFCVLQGTGSAFVV